MKNDQANLPLPEQAPAFDPSLQAELLALRDSGKESNASIGAGIHKSESTISLYIAGKYTGNVTALEASLRNWLRDRRVRSSTGVATIETDLTKLICRKIEAAHNACELAVIVGPAGIGKTRGQSIYLGSHPLAIGFRTLPWHSGINSLADELCQAAKITRITKGEKRWDTILRKTAGGGFPLLVDDAHELAPRALQCVVDYHDETGNPVILFGLPKLQSRLLADDRRARRVGQFIALHIEKPKPLVEHLVDQLAHDANGDRDALISLCLQVATGPGMFGAVEKQLKSAARYRKQKPDLAWPAAFRAAHKRLLRSYTLKEAA